MVANGTDATVGGGENNKSIGDGTTIGGGLSNRADPTYATVGGGIQNVVEANAVYRNGDADAIARAEEIAKAHVAAHADIMAVPAAERQAAHARF